MLKMQLTEVKPFRGTCIFSLDLPAPLSPEIRANIIFSRLSYLPTFQHHRTFHHP